MRWHGPKVISLSTLLIKSESFTIKVAKLSDYAWKRKEKHFLRTPGLITFNTRTHNRVKIKRNCFLPIGFKLYVRNCYPNDIESYSVSCRKMSM